MPEYSLDRVLTFNDQLKALIGIGLPMELGFGGNDVAETLTRLDHEFSGRVGRGANIDQFIDELALPKQYRAALDAWLESDNPTAVYQAISQPASTTHLIGRQVNYALVHPLVAFVLSYLGFIYFCVFLFPKIESFYRDDAKEPKGFILFLSAVCDAMPIWVPLVPLILICGIFVWRRKAAASGWSWVPGAKRYVKLQKQAWFADQVADMAEAGNQDRAAVDLLASISDVSEKVDFNELSESSEDSDKNTKSYSPLINWAMNASPESAKPSVLRFVARMYRRQAQQQSRSWRVVLPSAIGVLIGGVFVLGYGLSLFLPMAQLLESIALPGGY